MNYLLSLPAHFAELLLSIRGLCFALKPPSCCRQRQLCWGVGWWKCGAKEREGEIWFILHFVDPVDRAVFQACH